MTKAISLLLDYNEPFVLIFWFYCFNKNSRSDIDQTAFKRLEICRKINPPLLAPFGPSGNTGSKLAHASRLISLISFCPDGS